MSSETFSLLFEKSQHGDAAASNAVYEVTFRRLRGIASALLLRERPSHTLQPTALVGEAFLKLHRLHARIAGEEHFFRIAARAMKQVLIDYSRTRGAGLRVCVEDVPELLAHSEDVPAESKLAVRAVFERLRTIDTTVASTIWLRGVEGRTIGEVSRIQGREAWRVRADYDFGVQWMAKQLSR